MTDDSSTTRRREFLGKVAAASLALGLAGVVPQRLEAAVDAGGPDVEKWPDVHGKHRQMYDAISWNHGFSLVWAMIFLDTNKASSNLSDGDLNAVVVMRHEAIPLAFTDPSLYFFQIGSVKPSRSTTRPPRRPPSAIHSSMPRKAS